VRILFDQGTPVPIRRFLQDHTVSTAAQQGWHQLENGELLNAAEAAGFDMLITTDKNMRYQQNLTGRKIAIILLSKQQWPELQGMSNLLVPP
jgi:predicted nuclease of predicted toxin-antitoxin system